MNYFSKIGGCLLIILFAAVNFAFAQAGEITKELRAATIDSVLQLLKDKYAYPEIASKMEAAIRERQKRGEYDSIADGNLLAGKLTADLRAVFDDKHLKMSFSANPIPAQSSRSGAPTPEEIAAARARQRRENFGLQKVEILKGNVGFIKLNYFAPLDWAADAYAAALGVVADTDALIIDVRENRGSMDINTIPFFCSYLFENPVQLGDILVRETKETRQLWTYARVAGRKYLDKPVYVLTGNKTASGAEAFVGQLKRLKRATLVGEVSAGATMPGGTVRVNEYFSIWISTGRSSGGAAANENKGVVPDVLTSGEKAMQEAYVLALKQLSEKTGDEDWKNELKTIAAQAAGTGSASF
jgi:C-terminal processing protease CtpA/Prc